MGFGGLNSGPHAYANTSLMEPSLHRPKNPQLFYMHIVRPKHIETAQIDQTGRKERQLLIYTEQEQGLFGRVSFPPTDYESVLVRTAVGEHELAIE